MYLDYWQLTTRPFEPVAPERDRAAYYRCESHEAALLKLRYAVENRRAAALLAGPPGVGKTMLVAMLRREVSGQPKVSGVRCQVSESEPRHPTPETRHLISDTRHPTPDTCFGPFVHLVFPQMSSRDLLVYLAEQLGAPPAEVPRHTIEESVRRLEFLLTQNASQGRHAVVVIDEAHLLEDCGVLETLRLLLNFEVSGRPAMTLLLVGQMALTSAVARLPGLEQRLAVKTLVRSFTVEETASYVRHRLKSAGAARDIFTPDAVETLHYLSQGTPRQINRLADLALLVGYADALPQIAAQQIEAVNEELVTIAAD